MSSEGTGRRLLRQAFTHPAVLRAGRAAVTRAGSALNYHLVRGMADGAARPSVERFAQAAPWTITPDYVRDGTVELLCREIADAGIEGDIAELGVYRGDFAWLMSELLPGRRVHLFDTFEGFAAEDVRRDAPLVENFIDFSATDPAAVVRRFRDPALVELHVGRFPDTAHDLAARFALVSIDADLYVPILSGLQWFYERLAPGGAILVHDYNNAAFGGAKQAVREFQRLAGVAIVPLPDWGGSAVVVKPGARGGT